jgi:hypothetical protein
MFSRPDLRMHQDKTGITLENTNGKIECTIPFTTIDGIRIEYRHKGHRLALDHRTPYLAKFRLRDGNMVTFSDDRIINMDWELIHYLHQHYKYHPDDEITL